MIIVTGGAGFIGSAVVWELNKRNINDCIIVDNLNNTEKWKNLVNLKFSDYIDKKDFINKLSDPIFSKNIDGIIHLGACSSTIEKDSNYLMKNNYEYSKILAEFCINNNKRFVYASSAATYGDGKLGFSDNENEIEKLQPLNIYGYSKHIFDLWIKRNNLLNRTVGLKYFNVFGPNEYHKGEMRSVVLKAYEQIKSTGKVKLFKSYLPNYKDGEQLRDFIYVKDAVKMTLYLYFNNEINGIFNIGTGKARTFLDLVKSTFKALGKEPNIEFIDMPDYLIPKYQYFTQADMNKIKSKGYSNTFYTLEEAIFDYVQNYLLKENQYLG